MQRERAISSDISDVAQTINLLVTNTVEALNKCHMRGGPAATRDLKRRIWVHFRIDAARTENALLPVHRLPAEVFLLCVDCYLAASPIGSGWDTGYYRRLQILSSVCWSWKSTIDNTPALWSWLLTGQRDEHAELCLARSASYPLAISFQLYRETVQEFNQRVLPNLGRCSTFNLGVSIECVGVESVHILGHFTRTQMPLLEFLTLSSQHDLVPNLDIFAAHPESPLRRVDLQSWLDLSFKTPPPLTLKHLSMRCLYYDQRNRLDPYQFFGVLNQYPALQHLEINDVQFQRFTDTTLDPLYLTHIRHLRLQQKSLFTLGFLKRAVLPSLQTFHGGMHPYYYWNSHDLDEIERLITPVVHKVLETLSGSSSLRLEVISAPNFIVKICDDTEDYIEISFFIRTRTSPVLSLQWVNQVIQHAPCPLPLRIKFQSFLVNFSDQSLVDMVISLPRVRSIIVIECTDVNPLMRSLGCESPRNCPLPELTDLVFQSIDVPLDPGVVEWVQNSRAPNILSIDFSISTDAVFAPFEKLHSRKRRRKRDLTQKSGRPFTKDRRPRLWLNEARPHWALWSCVWGA